MSEPKIKIIHLLHHLPLPNHLASTPEILKTKIGGDYIYLNKPPYWIGFWNGDLHVKTALETLKRYSDFEIECWRPYGNGIDRIFENKIDGIKHRVFPCHKHHIPYFGTWLWSKDIFRELKREGEKQKIILHIHDGHSRFISRLLLKLKKISFPIIYQHRSNKFAIFTYKNLKGIKKLNVVPLFVFRNQVKALNSVTLYLTDSRNEINFLKMVLKFNRVVHFKQGIDFNYFKPDQPKDKARKKLNLSQNKKIILYVGRFYSDKNVNKLIEIFRHIKSEIQNIELVLIGGYKTDEFYEMAIQAGAIVRERVPENELKYYYLAADVYVMPTFNDTVVHFGGFGNAPIQALACDLPIISKNIIHFPGSYAERDQIGFSYKNKEDLAVKIKMVLLSEKNNFECRKVARKYYDLDGTIRELYGFYQSVIV